MNTYPCPRGHQSSEADFCSECGAKIAGPSAAAAVGGRAAPAPVLCPDCQAPRAHDGGDFCEVCGYNFSTGAHGDVAFAQAAAASASPPAFSNESPPQPAVQSAPTPIEPDVEPHAEPHAEPDAEPASKPAPKWSLVASIDPSLREDGSPEPPAGADPITFRIEKPETLIGRHSRARGIEPEIALDFDDAVSHRHAIVTRLDDGSLSLRDIGSANGTRLNGADLPPLTDTALKDGDRLTLGHWTRLIVKANE